MIPHQIGLGFNQGYIDGSLAMPADASYVEAGLRALGSPAAVSAMRSPGRTFSLHLATAPTSQPARAQEAFLADLRAWKLETEVESVGIHLCGAPDRGLCRWGLGHDFEPTPSNLVYARELFERAREQLGVPILIENANFYDPSMQAAWDVFAFANELARSLDAGLILDLAHLSATAHNVGAEPRHLLGAVDLSRVRVIHLSGIAEGRDGLWHDGHTNAVHPVVWELLECILPHATHPIKLVVEHSAGVWRGQTEAYAADLERLRALLDRCRPKPKREIDFDRLAVGYLANVIFPEDFPELASAMGAESFRAVVRAWAEQFRPRADKADLVSFHRLGVGDASVIDPHADFVEFVEREILSEDAQ